MSWGSQVWTIASDGTVTAGFSRAGQSCSNGITHAADETLETHPTFTTTTISGTLSLAADITYQGSSYNCSGR